jgi:regulator of sigma E protease
MSLDAVTLVGAILAIGFLIIVHEAGHYFVARWCKMRVERFSIGFGPPIFSRKRGETDFTIGPIPFGGFVQIEGMLLTEDVDPDDERAYPNRPVWQRFLTIFAGPATNYLAAIALAFVFYNAVGVRASTARSVVGGVTEGYDAANKLEAGDIITHAAGEPVYGRIDGKSSRRFIELVQEHNGQPLPITVLRHGKPVDVEVTPKPEIDHAQRYGVIVGETLKAGGVDIEVAEPAYLVGIGLDEERADVGILGAAGHALIYPVIQTEAIIVGLYHWATGTVDGELMSVVGITAEVKRQIDRGWTYLIQMLMLLNIYLGLFNLFPLPALDGGRLVFLGYEMVTRRRANPKIEATVHMVGIMALMLLLIVVTYKDCARELGRFF